MLSTPQFSEFSKSDKMHVGPALLRVSNPFFHSWNNELLAKLMVHLRLPNVGNPSKSVQLVPCIKVNALGMHHLPMA